MDEKRKNRFEDAIMPKGSGSRGYDSAPTAAKLPDWNYWRHMPKVKPWEACALALNIDPNSLSRATDSMGALGSGSVTGFPNNEAADRFSKLLRLLNSNQFERQHFTENFAMGVRLSEFAAWCAPIVRDITGHDIPQELAALAVKKLPEAAGKSGDNDKQRDTTGQNYWRVVLNSNIKKLDEHKKATVRGIIKYLRNLNDARLPNKGGHDELIWIDDIGGEQCVQKKAVSNAASEARRLP